MAEKHEYCVTGAAFVSVQIKVDVIAENKESAEKIASMMFRRSPESFVVPNSVDESHPFQFVPFAEKI